MNTARILGAAIAVMVSASALVAEEASAGGGCAMMKKKEPAPAESCCCCKKDQAKTEAATKPQDLGGLVDQLKAAKDDQLLDSLAAVLNKVIEERKGGPKAEAPHVHQH
jgi:hypothetical protein